MNNNVYWDTSGNKWITIIIPVTSAQMSRLDSLFNLYDHTTPFDYALFDMRSASATYYVLSKAGLFEEISNHKNIIKHFYSKLLRKKDAQMGSKAALSCH